MTGPVAYRDGRFVPFGEAGLAVHDAGFVSGATVVDNARTYRQRLFRWADHLARFRRDCRDCYIPLDRTDAELTAVAGELVARNAALLPAGGELHLVTFATPGPLGVYVGEAANGPPTLGMATYPLPVGRYRRFFADGVTLAVAGVQSSAPDDLLPPRAKHRSRLHWHVADHRVRDRHPGGQAVILTPDGVGDTAVGGIVAVLGGRTVAIPPAGRVQESISVRVAAELAETLGLAVEERAIDLRAVGDEVSELLLCGTGFGVAGVRRLVGPAGERAFPWPGPVYQRLLAGWSELVGVDVAGQFLGGT